MRRVSLVLLMLLPLLALGQNAYNTFSGFTGGMSVETATTRVTDAGGVYEGEETMAAAFAVAFNGGFVDGIPVATWVLFFDKVDRRLVSVGLIPQALVGLKQSAANEILQGFAAGFGKGLGQPPSYAWDDNGMLRARFQDNGLKIFISTLEDDDGLWVIGMYVFFAIGVHS